MKSLNYAKLIEAIDENVVKVTIHFDVTNFDVTMGSYHGAELCELTGLYILSVLSSEFGNEKIGLYRDDGLNCFQNMTGSQAESVEKRICEIFESCGLKITIK